MFVIVDQIGQIIGMSESEFAPKGYTAILLPEDFEGDLNNAVVIDGEIVFDPSLKLENAKDIRKRKIKREAATLIAGSDWRVTRAQEQEALNVPGDSVAEVLAYREAIRRASNRAETEVDAQTDCESILSLAWAVTDSDYEGLGK